MGVGVGLGQHPAVGHGEELSVVGVVVFFPHAHDLGKGLVPHLAGSLHRVDAEAVHLHRRRAPSGAELEAAFAEVVEHGHPFRDARRMVDRRCDVEDGRAHVDALGGGQNVGHEGLGVGQVRVLVEEVMLGRPRVLEARLVGGLDVGDLVLQRLVLGADLAASRQ